MVLCVLLHTPSGRVIGPNTRHWRTSFQLLFAYPLSQAVFLSFQGGGGTALSPWASLAPRCPSAHCTATPKGTQVPEGRQQGVDQVARHPSNGGGGDRQSGAAAPYRQLRASWSAGPHTARPWGTRCRADSPHLGFAPVAVQLRKHPMRMSSRLRRRGDCPSRACSAQATLARDLSVRGRWGGSARLTWASQRRRAGAGSLRAIQRRVRCSQVLRWLRETGCGPRRPIQYGGGGERARYGGYATRRRVILLAVLTVRSERASPYLPDGGAGGYRAGMTGSTTQVAPASFDRYLGCGSHQD